MTKDILNLFIALGLPLYCSGICSFFCAHWAWLKCLQVEEQHRAGDYYRGRLLGFEMRRYDRIGLNACKRLG